MHIHSHSQVCNLGGEGGRPPLLFFEIRKNGLILERKAQIVSIFRLDFPIKMFV